MFSAYAIVQTQVRPLDQKADYMLLKIIGIGVLVLGIAILAGSIYGLHGMDNVGRAITALSPKWQGSGAEQDVWNARTRLYWETWMVAALFAIAGGLLLLAKRAAGLALCTVAATIVLVYPFVVRVFPGQRYPFEHLNSATGLTASIFLCIAISLHIRLYRARVH